MASTISPILSFLSGSSRTFWVVNTDASDSMTVSISLRRFILSVLPVATRSDMASETPNWGMISAAPWTKTISADIPLSSKYFLVR